MKKFFLFVTFLYSGIAFGQTTDTIVAWTFPDSNIATGARSDMGLAINIGNPITTAGGTNSPTFNRNGVTTYCARATGWNGGSGTKYWLVYFSTTNYNTLKIYSRQQSSTSSNGPRDFKVQYALSLPGTWTDVPSASILDSNDWSHGTLSNVSLPAACDNQDSVYLRWIMTSDTSVGNATVLQSGPNKIDNIIVTGIAILTSISSFENQQNIIILQNNLNKTLTVSDNEIFRNVSIYDVAGNLVYDNKNPLKYTIINTSKFSKGIYFLKVLFDDNTMVTRKISL